MGQNEMIFYIVAAGCMICLMIGIVRKPAYLLVLLLRGAFCAMIVYGISIVCMRKGITAPVNLNVHWNRCTVGTSRNYCVVCGSGVFIAVIM